MCHAVTCPSCHKTTWAGCGQHVDQVMAGVPTPRRCTCNPTTTAAALAAGGSGSGTSDGFFARLFGR